RGRALRSRRDVAARAPWQRLYFGLLRTRRTASARGGSLAGERAQSQGRQELGRRDGDSLWRRRDPRARPGLPPLRLGAWHRLRRVPRRRVGRPALRRRRSALAGAELALCARRVLAP